MEGYVLVDNGRLTEKEEMLHLHPCFHSIKGRPSFMEMLDDITAEKDDISFVLVYKLSRFGRNAADVLKSMQLLLDFDTLYERMTDLEKKQFMRTFIESIELYPEKKNNGRIISKIELRFPVYYDGQEGNEIRMPDKNTVETVVCLDKKKPKDYVEIGVDADMELPVPKKKKK